MREIKDVSAYLVVSCVHLGTTQSILNVLAQVQKYYKAKTLHLGKISTDEELKMWHRRMNDIKTWEKIDEECLSESQKNNLKNKKLEVKKLETAQQRRVRLIQNTFGDDTEFVINKEQMLPITMDWNEVETEKDLGIFLKASSVPPNGEKVSFSPITPRSFSYFRKRESSFITPHPTPVLRSMNREGLNKAFNMMTTGSLQNVKEVNRCSEHHFISNLPSAILVLIDNETGEFHSKRLHFESVQVGITSTTFIVDDGLVFTSGGASEVSAEEKAVFSTDEHAKYEHLGVLAACISLINKHKPKTFIGGGDTGDFPSVCRHTIKKPGIQEGRRLLDDLLGMKRVTDAQTSNLCIKTKIMLPSNHPKWLSDFVNDNPMLIGMLDWSSLQKLYWSDWNFVSDLKNEIYKWNDIVCRHGHQENSLTSASDLFIKYLRGHGHSHQEIQRGGTAGAACMLGMGYLDGNVTAWTNTIVSLTAWKNKASFNIKTVLHDDNKKISRFAYRGTIIEVEWHKYPEEK